MGFSYITDVLETLILRDIRQKYRIRNAELGTKKLDPLRRIRDAYPKCIIARTGHETTDWDGIKVIDLAHWLMGESDELIFWRAMAWVEIIERGFCPAGRLMRLSSRDFLLARSNSILEKLPITPP